MIWRIDVFPKERVLSKGLISQIKDLGISGAPSVYERKAYLLDANIPEKDIRTIASSLLIDPVLESYSLHQGIFE